MVKIPFTQFPAFSEEIILDNIPYRFSFSWNTRGEFWSMIIQDRSEVVLIAGVKLILNFPLLFMHPGKNLPPGELWVIDTTESLERIGRTDFENNVSLIYLTEEENATI